MHFRKSVKKKKKKQKNDLQLITFF